MKRSEKKTGEKEKNWFNYKDPIFECEGVGQPDQTNKVQVKNVLLCGGHYDINWVEILATNNGGGLLCINFVANVKALGDGYIYLEGLWKEIGSNVVVINVYSPCDNLKKSRLKEDLLVRKG